MCPTCRGTDWSWERSNGLGVVHTFTVTYRPLHPAFSDVPYAHGIIETGEGVRLVTSIVDVDVDKIRVGLSVEVAFRTVAEDLVLPVYRAR
jgi:uncharacterized OB-fold protein